MSSSSIINLVDDSLELSDPHPDIHQLYVLFDHQFFWGKLNERACTVTWSKRMTTCAGVCQFYRKTGLCCVRLSEPLLKLRRRRDLVETLLHEMIHAYLFVTGGAMFMDRDGHGPEFQSHMNRINSLAGTSITIFHSFHAEVTHYKQHWWRCSGPCAERPPYYGWVKRAMNRKPGPYDYWWNKHKAECGGEYVKVKEPENGIEKSKENISENKRKIKENKNVKNQPKIDNIFSVEDSKASSTDLSLLPSTSSNNINYLFNDENKDDICIVGEVIKRPKITNSKSIKENINKKNIFPGKDESSCDNEIDTTNKQQLHMEEKLSPLNTNKNNSEIFNSSNTNKTPNLLNSTNDTFNYISPPPPLYFGEDNSLFLNELSPLNNQQPSTSLKENNNSIKRPFINNEEKNEDLSDNCEEINNEKNNDDDDILQEEDVQPVNKKRKKRTKEEIEADKLQKEVNRVQRQMQSAKNTKCEQYLFCYFSTRILEINDNLRVELDNRFNERSIPNQIIYEKTSGNLMRITWRRKQIEAFINEGKLNKLESMELKSSFCCVLSSETFTALAKTKEGLINFIKEQTASHKQQTKESVRLTLIVIGKHSIRENNLSTLIFDAYERYRAQIRIVPDALDFSFLIVQMHRALAKEEKKNEKIAIAELNGIASNHFTISKGISEGPGIVTDWWARMLEHVPRLSEEQRRAIVKEHPNPIKLMANLLNITTNSPGGSMFKLSEIKGESGKRLGPVMAQRIYKMLTSIDGEEIIDLGVN